LRLPFAAEQSQHLKIIISPTISKNNDSKKIYIFIKNNCMKISIPVFFVLLMALGTRAQTSGTCTLTGDIRGLGNHRVFINYSADTAKVSMHRDSVRAHHGHFVFHFQLDAPVHAMVMFLRDRRNLLRPKYGPYLTFRHHGYTSGALTGIMLENRDMHWHTRLDSINQARVDNAPMNDTLLYYRVLYSHLSKSDSALIRLREAYKGMKYKSLPHEARHQSDSLSQAINWRAQDSMAAYVFMHPASPVSAKLTQMLYNYPYEKSKAVADALDASLQSNIDVVHFRKKLERGASAHVSPGNIAPEIVLPDAAGKDIALSSLKGKYVLLDFWASWCGPCRGESPNLVKAYKQLHKKGLEIYSVSLDLKKEAWQKAIAKDKLSWIHVSDLKGWECKASGLYSVSGIPSNFLIDPSGKIIATNIRGKKTATELA
jgi:peroxiredoxin